MQHGHRAGANVVAYERTHRRRSGCSGSSLQKDAGWPSGGEATASGSSLRTERRVPIGGGAVTGVGSTGGRRGRSGHRRGLNGSYPSV